MLSEIYGIISYTLARRLLLPILLAGALFCVGHSMFPGNVLRARQTGSASTNRSEAFGDTLFSTGQPNKPQYRLIFPLTYDGKIRWRPSEYARMVESQRKSFIDEMNKAGENGYRFVSGLRSTPYAMLKLDEGKYEYDLFVTTSSVHFAKSGLEERLAKVGGLGFRIVEHIAVGQMCEIEDLNAPVLNEKCTYRDLFLLEREKSTKSRAKQVLIASAPGWGSKPSSEMASLIDEMLADGFYPVRAISRFEILLEQAKNKDAIDKPDVQVVRASWGENSISEKVNELARDGYRLASVSNGIGILYRNNETRSIPVAYFWLRADKANFERELAKLQATGAIYRTTYPSEKGTRNSLIFERRLDEGNKKAEYKILSFDFNLTEDKTQGKVRIGLNPSSQEVVNKMNQLAKDGYHVRDLFDSGNVSVILERIR